MTQLCVPLTGRTCEEMADEIRSAGAAGADMIELRLDYLQGWTPEAMRELLAGAKAFDGRVVVTCRVAEEGGHYCGDEADRMTVFELAAQVGLDYIDVEYEAWRQSPDVRGRIGALCAGAGPKLILSKHDFERTPEDPAGVLDRIAAEPCHVVKLACQANSIMDSVRMLEALRSSCAQRPTIALTMGETGALSRVLARKSGALLTFASLEAGKESAPGQVTLAQMRELYRWDAIDEATAVYGVIGCPVAHSMSPAILNAAFAEAGVNAVYLPMRVEPAYEAFESFIDGCIARPWLGFGGCSVTIPHKQNLLRYVEARHGRIEPLASRIGAANTLTVGRTARVSACNTDYRGALDALCAGIGCSPEELGGRSVAVLGAGGVSRAIVAGLRDSGCAVTIYNRTHAKAEALASEFGATALPVDQRGHHDADVVINGTSIGMWPDTGDTPMPAEGLAGKPVVFDTIYNPMETRLLREARERGCQVIDGVAMFVRQAAAQFECWTGRPAPAQTMREVVIAQLSHDIRRDADA